MSGKSPCGISALGRVETDGFPLWTYAMSSTHIDFQAAPRPCTCTHVTAGTGETAGPGSTSTSIQATLLAYISLVPVFTLSGIHGTWLAFPSATSSATIAPRPLGGLQLLLKYASACTLSSNATAGRSRRTWPVGRRGWWISGSESAGIRSRIQYRAGGRCGE